MLKEKVENALNSQIELEQFSSQLYLAMASWAETQGLSGTAKFLYLHTEEERLHMLKFVHYVNDRGGHATISSIEQPKKMYDSVKDIFQEIMTHEYMISAKINDLVGICADERDFTTQNFLQWFVTEQIEEESKFKGILDKLNLLGNDKANLYMFDNELNSMALATIAAAAAGTQA